MTESQLSQLLEKHIPATAAPAIARLLHGHKVHLTVKWNRESKLGDYRLPQHAGENHRITINVSLNQFAFLLTLVHELAHLLTYTKHPRRTASHGAEWKQEFKLLMHDFLGKNIFPPDVELAIRKYIANPAASSCSDTHLLKTLNKYNPIPTTYVDALPEGTHFQLDDKRIFVKGTKLRKNYKCVEVQSGRHYLVSGVAAVKKVHPLVEARRKI